MVKKKPQTNRIITAVLIHIILYSKEIGGKKYSSKFYVAGHPKAVAPEIFTTDNLLKNHHIFSIRHDTTVVSSLSHFD